MFFASGNIKKGPSFLEMPSIALSRAQCKKKIHSLPGLPCLVIVVNCCYCLGGVQQMVNSSWRHSQTQIIEMILMGENHTILAWYPHRNPRGLPALQRKWEVSDLSADKAAKLVTLCLHSGTLLLLPSAVTRVRTSNLSPPLLLFIRRALHKRSKEKKKKVVFLFHSWRSV